MKKQAGPYMTVGQWLGTMILASIPLVGFIFTLIWLFGGGGKQERINYVRASVLYALIITVLAGVIVALLTFAFGIDVFGQLEEVGSATKSMLGL